MKNGLKNVTATLALSAAFAFAGNASANQIDYTGYHGGTINFVGNGTFMFAPSVSDLVISDGTAAGLTGQITGVYTIGAITTSAGLSTAAVSGSGLFQINDGSYLFSATLTWVGIDQHGTGGTLNTTGTVNLSNISYGGSNPDLVALDAAGLGIDTLTFQFIPAVSLHSLATSHHSTSFSGSLAAFVPDGGSTVALLGGAFLALGGFRRKFSR